MCKAHVDQFMCSVVVVTASWPPLREEQRLKKIRNEHILIFFNLCSSSSDGNTARSVPRSFTACLEKVGPGIVFVVATDGGAPFDRLVGGLEHASCSFGFSGGAQAEVRLHAEACRICP